MQGYSEIRTGFSYSVDMTGPVDGIIQATSDRIFRRLGASDAGFRFLAHGLPVPDQFLPLQICPANLAKENFN
jgi:hypothetical protein